MTRPEPWIDDALCAQVGTDDWFPEKGQSNLAAKTICRRCTVIVDCLAYAIRTDQRIGIYGGLSANERRTLKGKAAA